MPSSTLSRKRSKASPSLRFPGEPPAGLIPSRSDDLLRLLAVVAIAAAVAAACNRAFTILTRRPLPFCDSYDINTPLHPVSDLCEPCPAHGVCTNGNLECFRGYKRYGRSCTVDSLVNLTARKLSALVEHHVCAEYARVLCNEPGEIWFQEAYIVELLNKHKAEEKIDMDEDTFMLAMDRAMEILQWQLEKRSSSEGRKEAKCPDMLAKQHKTLQCRVRQWIFMHVPHIVAFSTLFTGLLRFMWKRHRNQLLSTRVEQLYNQVCEILKENASLEKSAKKEGEPWVVASWLRDHLLLPRERKDKVIWKKVEELILGDSRIDQYPKLIKGESKLVWEWQADESFPSKWRMDAGISKGIGNQLEYSSHLVQRTMAKEPVHS